MKSLKFRGFKVDWVKSGEKTASMRIFDDKDLRVGDELDLINSDTGDTFANAIITQIIVKPIGEIAEADLVGHEKWTSQREMMKTIRLYYGDKVTLQTSAKIIRFRLI